MATLTAVQPLMLDRDVARAIELLEKLQESGEVPVHKLQSLKKVLQNIGVDYNVSQTSSVYLNSVAV
ncbi:hypothetical protein DUI87_12667 [Hirundo rustica rustica]|uniref:L27 domain-containing protein n=1 Tax=Hirundo rustica rustica TaxID=333673 RepID=A0A3M0KBM8_HIRRU|nr:hypothetical protein DUI87_12667 [Hirundo rustica rustica]